MACETPSTNTGNYGRQFGLSGRIFWGKQSQTVGLSWVRRVIESLIRSSNLDLHPDWRIAKPDANGIKCGILSSPYYGGESDTRSTSFAVRHGIRRLNPTVEILDNGIASGESFGSATVTN